MNYLYGNFVHSFVSTKIRQGATHQIGGDYEMKITDEMTGTIINQKRPVGILKAGSVAEM